MTTCDMTGFDTARLHLRPIGEGDEALYCGLYTDPDLMRHIAAPMTLEAAKRSFGAACRQQSWMKQRWILLERSSAVPISIGQLGLFVDADATQGASAEIGVMLLDDWQKRGYAAEAIMAMAGGQPACSGCSAISGTRQALCSMAAPTAYSTRARSPFSGRGMPRTTRWPPD